MKIVEFERNDSKYIREAAELLFAGFREHWPNAWPNLETAELEVKECANPVRICRMAINESKRLIGWIGAIPIYDGHVWELHPLVVEKTIRNQGVGRALVHDLQRTIEERGGRTILTGTDDENGMTSLANVNL